MERSVEENEPGVAIVRGMEKQFGKCTRIHKIWRFSAKVAVTSCHLLIHWLVIKNGQSTRGTIAICKRQETRSPDAKSLIISETSKLCKGN